MHRLERSIPYFGGAEGTPFERFLLLPEINVVGTTEAEAEAGAGAHRPELTVAYPAPVAQADAVVVSSSGAPAPAKGAASTRWRGSAGQWLGGAQRGCRPAVCRRRASSRPCASSGPRSCDEALVVHGRGWRSPCSPRPAARSISTGETAPTSAEPASTDLSNANPGDCIAVDVDRQPGEDRPADRPGQGRSTTSAGHGQRQLRVRPAAEEVVGRGRHAARRRVARPRRQRPAARDLVARSERLGRHRQPTADRQGPGADRPGQPSRSC